MLNPRRPSRRRRRCWGRRRIIRFSAIQPRSLSDDDLPRVLAYRNGLWAAELLKRHFPTHWEQHVAWQQVTLPFLACVTEYFLMLAHQHLLYIDECWADLNLYGDPQRTLVEGRTLSEAEAIGLLTEDLSQVLLDPFPCFWGLPREWESLFSSYGMSDHNILLLAVWRLLSDTAWANDEGEYEDNAFLENAVTADALAVINSLPKLPKDTSMDRWCDHLDTQLIALTEDRQPFARLGTMVRYCVRRTANGYADYSAEIVAEDWGGTIGFDFWSSPEELRDNRAAQEDAERIYRRYADLDDCLRQTPALLTTLAARLIDAAASLEHHPVDPLEQTAQQLPIDAARTENTMPADDVSTPPRERDRPWMRRRVEPHRLPPEDILMDRERPEAQISVFEDGTTLLTRRDGHHGYRCYPIAPETLAQTLAQLPMSVGMLVPHTLGAGWIKGQPWYCLYVPPHLRMLRSLVRERERSYTFVLPPLIWWGWSNHCRIWALGDVPDNGTFPELDATLHTAPFPNCSANGSICWGTATAPTITTAADLHPALDLFLAGTYFNDHLASDKSKRYPVNVLLMWAEIGDGVPYPVDDLVPANVGTTDRPSILRLRHVINAQWRVSSLV